MFSDQGIVLRGYPFGEADRIVVLVSPNQGKVRAVAKGVRRTKSRFGGRLEPLTHVDLLLYQGRNLATVTQVSVIEPFPRLRLDLDAVMTAGAMAEAVGKVVVEGEKILWCAKLYGKMAQDVGIFPSIYTYGVLPYAMIFCALVSLSNNDRFSCYVHQLHDGKY